MSTNRSGPLLNILERLARLANMNVYLSGQTELTCWQVRYRRTRPEYQPILDQLSNQRKSNRASTRISSARTTPPGKLSPLTSKPLSPLMGISVTSPHQPVASTSKEGTTHFQPNTPRRSYQLRSKVATARPPTFDNKGQSSRLKSINFVICVLFIRTIFEPSNTG